MTIPIFLRPLTRIYFGRPGSLPAGEAHVGESWFPPPISAFQGMIRTRLLDEAGVFSPPDRVRSLVGPPDSLPGGWQLKGPFPGRIQQAGMEMWLPAPAVLLNGWNDGKGPVVAEILRERVGGLLMDDQVPSVELPGHDRYLAGAPASGHGKPAGGWLHCRNMLHLLANQPNNMEQDGYSPDMPPFVRREQHTGLAREKSHDNDGVHRSGQAVEGMLYTLSMLRFAPDSGLCGWFSGDLDPGISVNALKHGVVTAGKKGGMIAFNDTAPVDPAWNDLAAGKHLFRPEKERCIRIWVILMTPGRWNTDDGLRQKLERALDRPGIDVSVLTMFSPGLISLGGFSLAGRRPRPVRYWYGAGTSLLVELKTNKETDLVGLVREKLNNKCLLASRQELPFGYGHVLAALHKDTGGNDGN